MTPIDWDMSEEKLRKLFAVYMDKGADFWGLGSVLGSIQKSHCDHPGGWMQFVIDYMTAMELHDSGMFPSEWFPEEDEA